MQRSAVFKTGPRFFEREGETWFENVLDARSRFGPRPAEDADITTHAKAYEAYLAGDDEVSAEEVMRPPVTFVEPPEGAPEPEETPIARRRRRAIDMGSERPLGG